jgi:hypothetical protein
LCSRKKVAPNPTMRESMSNNFRAQTFDEHQDDVLYHSNRNTFRDSISFQ